VVETPMLKELKKLREIKDIYELAKDIYELATVA
jgi:hypothetical protein